MVSCDLHPFCKIKPVRVEPLHTGIKLKMVAAMFPRLINEPIEKLSAKTRGTIGSPGHEIIDVHELAGEQRFQISAAGNRADFAIGLDERDEITVALLTLHLIDEFLFVFKVTSQFAHHRETPPDILFRFRDTNVCGVHADSSCCSVENAGPVSRFPSYQRSSFLRDRAPRNPPSRSRKRCPTTWGPEYILNFRPDDTIGSSRILNRPIFFNASEKNTSSATKRLSSRPPTVSKFLRVVNMKAPAASFAPK